MSLTQKLKFFIFTLVLVLLAFLVSNVVLRSTPEKLETKSTRLSQNMSVCAIFFCYGGKTRYENEVVRTMSRLKELNPDMRTILYTDNILLRGPHANIVVEREKFTGSSWLPRLQFLSNVSQGGDIYGDCALSLSLDSHVSVCTSEISTQLVKAFDQSPSNAIIATNVENAPQDPYRVSPFRFWNESNGRAPSTRMLPHNFAIAIRNGNHATRLLRQWEVEMKGNSGDDQFPLMRVLERTSNFSDFIRLRESAALALKSIDKGKFGMWPRFTYLIEAGSKVSLVHSFHPKKVPQMFEADFCSFVNANSSLSRMVFQENEKSDYELIYSHAECRRRFMKWEPRICDEFSWPWSGF